MYLETFAAETKKKVKRTAYQVNYKREQKPSADIMHLEAVCKGWRQYQDATSDVLRSIDKDKVRE